MDWDFREESTKSYYPHNLCWYPSRFLPQIPAQFISALSSEGDLVYDPFCGCGTTLVESLKLGRKAIATDVSPIATFITTTKARIVSDEFIDVGQLRELHNAFGSGSKNLFQEGATNTPVITQGRSLALKELGLWYHPSTLEDMLDIQDAIEKLQEGLTRDVAKAAFLAISMPASGLPTDRPYTYYADNVKPKTEILKKDAPALFRSRLARIIAGENKKVGMNSPQSWRCQTANILDVDADNIGLVDLVVTSPPYLGVTDYITGFRLAHLWYSFSCDINRVKHDEIGARWKRKRSSGLGDYLSDMDKAIRLMESCLRPGGHICLVLGEAKKFSDAVLESLLHNARDTLGLTVVSALSRKVSQNFFLHPSGGVPTEAILVFRK